MTYRGWAYRWRYLLTKLSCSLRLLRSSPPPQLKLGLHAMFQNEAPYLREWIEYHLKLGFDRIYLTNDASQDHYLSVLQPFIDRGQVVLEEARQDWNFFDREEWHKNRILRYARGRYTWMAFLDVDEFIFAPDQDLRKWLQRHSRLPGIVLNWMIFGTAGVERLQAGEKITQKLNRRFPQAHQEHYQVKSLVQPHRGFIFFNNNPHYPQYSPLARLRHPSGHRFHPARPLIERRPLSINHYWYRTEEFYREVKQPRRRFFAGQPRPAAIENWHRQQSQRVWDYGLMHFWD